MQLPENNKLAMEGWMNHFKIGPLMVTVLIFMITLSCGSPSSNPVGTPLQSSSGDGSSVTGDGSGGTGGGPGGGTGGGPGGGPSGYGSGNCGSGYQGPTGDIQLDSYCQAAYNDLCNGGSRANADSDCQILTSVLQISGSQTAHQYCPNYCP